LFLAFAFMMWRYRVQHSKGQELKAKVDASSEIIAQQKKDIDLMVAARTIKWEELAIGRRLGHGAAGDVFAATMPEQHGMSVVVKVLLDSADYLKTTDDAEINFLMKVRHKRLVMFLGCGRKEDGDIFIVLEAMEASLDTLIWVAPSLRKAELTKIQEAAALRDATITVTNRRASLSGEKGAPPRLSSSPTGAEEVSKVPTWGTRLQVLADVSQGMAYLHGEHHSIHRDLKSPNILVTRDDLAANSAGSGAKSLRAKVADFGLSKIMHEHAQKKSAATALTLAANKLSGTLQPYQLRKMSNLNMQSTINKQDLTLISEDDDTETMSIGTGTPLWMAPELCAKCDADTLAYSQAVDIYAFGMVMWECLELRKPWASYSFRFSSQVMDLVVTGARPRLTMQSGAPLGYCNLMTKCWSQNSHDRPHFFRVVDDLEVMMDSTDAGSVMAPCPPTPTKTMVCDKYTVQGPTNSSNPIMELVELKKPISTLCE